ncbi:restriction modification system DNA specificity domain-containing protein [Mycolicibacterium anyangense]|uniref:Restriction modification system DNA specificity domain-containing protein n=1 Tax=Mycolicibacterium anyangense TaxID=1431246 RepID=A0A6N4WEX4_9MYCO|nr:restriction endonuclease subunit S [Mycolicibacterium anyangense]BBZ78492.1 restriction modification system DNA specificity domain-containing protein [Mycolicibacterium anyangense]
MTESVRLKWLLDERDERAGERVATLPLLSVSITRGVQRREAEDTTTRAAAEDLSNYKIGRAGDLVINRMRAFQGALGIAPEDGVVSPDYSVLRVSPLVEHRWLNYYLTSTSTVSEMASLVRGIGGTEAGNVRTPRLNVSDLHSMRIELESLDKQRAIADYLDRETARIDTLIEEQRRLVEMLRERRSSVISHAVGSGLDRSVEFKPSGLGAVPYVPRHWPVMPLRHALTYQEGPGILAADFRDEGVPLLRVSGVRTSTVSLAGCNYLDPEAVARRWAHFQVERGDLLISASASMGTVSEVVSDDVVGAVPYTGLIRMKPGQMTAAFVRWFVVSDEFMHQVESMKTGSTIQHFGPSHLAQMRVALPPPEEQRRIVAYLDEQTAKIDTLVAETERFIELSRERRSALITAAVTGQIDVRGEVA